MPSRVQPWSHSKRMGQPAFGKGRSTPTTKITVDDTPESSPEAFETQIRALYLQTTGFALADDATEHTALIAVWKEIYSVEASPISAWSGVLSAILRDPRVIFY